MSEALEVLVAARELISEPERWTQLANARRRDGGACAVDADGAQQWCLRGALMKVSRVPVLTASALSLLAAQVRILLGTSCSAGEPGGLVAAFGDHHSHAAGLSLFDRAIAAERAAQ